MKVKIMQRSVYHKVGVVEIEIPDLIDEESEVQQYLIDNEHLFMDKIDEKMSKAEYEFGFGTDYDSNSHYDTDFNETDNESEWRYEIVGKNYGGHL
jgi:hypothetical protein